MDFLKDNIKTIYFKYLAASFGSTLITSIYGIVDMAMVGQYHGSEGSAALAVVAPIWNIIYSLGLLMGIGGSVLFNTARGSGGGDAEKKSNEYFTASLIGSAALAVIVWLAVIFFDRELLTIFGASDNTLSLAREYVFPIKFAVPFFLFNQMLTAYVRSDKNPALATAAVLSGGIFNVFGDYFFVFTCDMGAKGAGVATAAGSAITCTVMLSHFFSRKNTLRLTAPVGLLNKLKEISVTGFATFFIDVAMGILTIIFNRQIMKYLDTNALAVYGVIVNISTFAQCCAYSVGQAAQTVISTNFGAGNGGRIRQTLRYALGTAAFFGVLWTALSILMPNTFIRIFMTPTPEVLEIAPSIFRRYGISFILLPLNVFSTYYFQALMEPKISFAASVARGVLISGIMLYVLPVLAGASAIWFAMPVTELIVAIYSSVNIYKCTKKSA